MDNSWIVPILHTGNYFRYPNFCGVLTKFGVSGRIFIQGPSVKFYGKPFNGSHAEACGQIDRRTETDVKPQIATVQTRLQVFSKPTNACRGGKFVTLKYSETRAFACHFRPTVCCNWLSIFMILRKKSDYFPKYY